MKHFSYIRWFTFISLLAIITLQFIWLYNTYKLIQQDIQKECNNILDNALYTEINLASKHIPEGTEITGGPQNDSISSMTYLYDGLHKLGIQYSIHEIDSIIGIQLKERNIYSEFVILSINPKNQIIYEKSNNHNLSQLGIIKSNIIPTRIDFSYGIQMMLDSPYIYIIGRMGLLLISTIILVIFVISCIAYQIRIIARINKISQIREDFSYAMVHDMKTPLTTIFTALSFLHSGRLDDKPETKEKFFNVAKEEADRLLTLTNKLLTISKLENKKMKMECEKIALEPMLVRLADKFKVKSHKPVSFEFDLQTPEIYADAEYIEEVFSNLIDNSIKYSKERVDIRISSSKNDLYSIIKIYDNGFGISEKDQRSIFNKYERAAAGSRNRRKKASGFGLGLNFVQQVIEAHKGKIFVNSIEGEFTEFIIYLPLMVKEL
ncbi:MAG: HAMP domain-containing histidine kinase [Candidatus Phocaeicola faecigallinarum]|uniref:histidine kinase n=1 Tax=Candidatus Phocaeicola faecigallinarum TaxID=2838732 RepID=A0A948WYD1_9BACT|nr:HAMP domain-containing histidine kinase [Candidatus Phocaeicola faecigallinarum]